MVDLSILIPSYNTKEVTLTCLKSIFDSLSGASFSYEVIVYDNASSDGSSAAISKRFPQVRLIASDKNVGFGRANNEMAAQAKGTVLFCLNSDTEVIDKAIVLLYRFFTSKKNSFDIVGPRLFNTDLTPQPSAGSFYTLPVVFGALYLRGDYWGITRWSHEHIEQVDWVSGAAFMIEAKLYKELKGFDEGIFMYMEEIDLMQRARKYGYLTGYFPDAKFIHYGSLSSGGRTEPIINVYKGFLYLYRKHYGRVSLFLLQLLLLVKALCAFIIGVITNNSYLKKTYAKAIGLVFKA